MNENDNPIKHSNLNLKRKRNDQSSEYCLFPKFHCCQETQKLQNFQYRNHSLKIPASQVAALTGYHPYASIPQLFVDLVYQGSLGQDLLRHDANLLGLSLVSEDEALMKIASKAATSNGTNNIILDILQTSIAVGNGTKRLSSIKEANELKSKLAAETTSSSKPTFLSNVEMKLLNEGVKHKINTGFGSNFSNENDALDLYEKQCGWEVRERNSVVMCWSFGKKEDFVKIDCDVELTLESPMTDGMIHSKVSSTEFSKNLPMRTVVPLGKAFPLSEIRETLSHRLAYNYDDDKFQHDDMTSRTRGTSPENAFVIDDSEEDDNHAYCDKQKLAKKHTPPTLVNSKKPFFYILGAVDGIRDELYQLPSSPSSKKNKGKNDDQNLDKDCGDWALRQIVVECKHRMKRVFLPPPIYDQIQAIVYSFMYGTDQAEIVQVVRKNDCSTNNQLKKPNDISGKENYKFVGKKAKDNNTENSCNRIETQITCSRVSLDDPVYHHGKHWHNTILPRLRSFVEAVYSIRSDDGKRYRMLTAMAASQSVSSEEDINKNYDLWNILFCECPWIKDCDTAYLCRRYPSIVI